MMKNDASRWRWFLGLTVLFLAAGLIVMLLFRRVPADTLRLEVRGPSMSPALQHGQAITLRVRPPGSQTLPDRGEVVAVDVGGNLYLKRVIGLPGDWVEVDPAGRVRLNGEPLDEPYATLSERDRVAGSWQIAAGCLFVMGDQRGLSVDSRQWGCVPAASVIGVLLP